MDYSAEELSDRILACPAMKEIDIPSETLVHEQRLARVLGGAEIYVFLIQSLAVVSLQRNDTLPQAMANALVLGFALGRSESADVALNDFTETEPLNRRMLDELLGDPPSEEEGP